MALEISIQNILNIINIPLFSFLCLLTIPETIFGNCKYLGNDRRTSFPFISGDTFRDYCDWIVDEADINCDPRKVKEGDTIFVRTDMVPEFIANIHPLIPERYILVTHNSDYPIPGPSSSLLSDDKLIAWFGQNIEFEEHSKLHGLPIGIANRYWSHGDIHLVSQAQVAAKSSQRPFMLYMNFLIRTYPIERSLVYNTFVNQPFCITKTSLESDVYLYDLTQTKFVLSPRGNGIDCHRTWEALLMGAIPIVISSSLNPLYENLPVLIINEWNEITFERLQEEWKRISTTKFDLEKLYAQYWFDQISKVKMRECGN